jgi:ABC-2 type transport system permease protein
VPLALLMALTIAVSMIVSSLYPRFRDVAIIWSVLATVLFYGSPVLYGIEVVPDTLQDILMLNPLTPLLELARRLVIDPTAPGPFELADGALYVLVPIAIYIAVCALAVWVFNREAPRIAEQL